jgi:hypothetical protein
MRKHRPKMRSLDQEDGRGGVASQQGISPTRREACGQEYDCTTLEYMGHPLCDKGIDVFLCIDPSPANNVHIHTSIYKYVAI